MLYIDSSAFVARYLDEPGTDLAAGVMAEHAIWTTARLTAIEVVRALHLHLASEECERAVDDFALDWAETVIVGQHELVADFATEVALEFGVRTLDAIQLASAWQAGARDTTFLTFDKRQAAAARELEFEVVGVD